MTKYINKIIRVSTKHPILAIIVVLIISIAVFPGLFKIELDNNIRGFLGEDFDILVNTNNVEKIFEIPKSVFFISVEADNIYSKEILEYVNLLHKQIYANINDIDQVLIKGKQYNHNIDKLISEYDINDVESITIDGIEHRNVKSVINSLVSNVESIINAVDVNIENDVLETYDLIIEENGVRIIPSISEELQKLKFVLEDNENYEGLYYSKIRNEFDNPTAWILSVEVSEEALRDYYDIVDYIEELIEKTKSYGYNTKIFGIDYINRAMNLESGNDVQTQILLVAFVIMFVFFLNFKSPAGVLLPELNTIISVFWVFGLMGHFGIKFSIIGLLILPVLFAVTSSYSIHSLNQYYKERYDYKEGETKSQHISNSMSHILTTISLAGITTIVSLISLLGSNIVHIKTFGIFASIGVLISVFLSLTFIPALLVLTQNNSKKSKKKKSFNNTLMDKMIRKTTYFIIQKRFLVFGILLSLAIIFIIGINFINTDSSFVTMFEKGHEIRKLSDHFSKHFGGVTTLNVTIENKPIIKTSLKDIINNYYINNIEIFNNRVSNSIVEDINKNKEIDKIIKDNISDDPFEDPFNNNNSNFGNEDDPFEDPFDNNNDTDNVIEKDKNNLDDPFGDPFNYINQEEINNNEFSNNALDNTFEDIESDIDKFKIDIDNYDDSNFYNALKSDFLKEIEKFSNHLLSVKGVGRVYSYADIIKRLHYIWNDKNIEYKKIPDNDGIIMDYKEIFSGDDNNANGVIDSIENLIESNYNMVNIIVTLQDIGNQPINTGDYERIEEDISKYIQNNFKDMNIDYKITGWAILHKDVQNEIVKGQLISIFASFFVIFIIVSFLFKSIISGLISIIPLSSSIFITFGLMGYTGVPLDVATALISAIAIGIAVDDTIHYMLNLYTIKKKMGNDVSIETLIYKTSVSTGKAIIYTSIALIFGFLVVLFSTFIPIRQFAYLTAFTLFVATIATLWALPSIILIFPKLVGIKKKNGKNNKFNPDEKEQ